LILSQTPLRVSLFGGGTDFAGYYKQYGGAVLSLAVNKHVHVAVQPRWEPGIVLHHWAHEYADRVDDIEHGIIRECLRLTGVTNGVQISCMADVPTGGSGLGASSALAVGLLNALFAYIGERRSAAELAELACHIEIDVLGEPIGKQDQYAAAFGGCAEYRFNPDGSVAVERIGLSVEQERELLRHAVVFYTGRTRRAAEILSDQKASISSSTENLHALKANVAAARALLCAGDMARLGALLHQSWGLKKKLSARIYDELIEELYRRGRRAGAFGGKLLGAGGGGFFLFLCPPERQPELRAAFAKLRELPVAIEPAGSRVLINAAATSAAGVNR